MNDKDGKTKLIEGIKEDAGKEAEKILSQARAAMEERKKSIESQIDRIMKEAGQKSNEQVELIRKNAKSTVSIEKKRYSLRIMDRIVGMTINKVKAKMTEKIGTPGYEEILLRWIVEAAIGLNVNKAEVNVSLKEKQYITEKLMKKAGEILLSLTGKKIILTMSQAPPLLAQGVVLTAKDGKTAFNNQVPTRLLRYQSEIRKMIYTMLFSESIIPEITL